MICDKFGWNLPSGSGEDLFFKFKFVNVFLQFPNNLPLEKGEDLHLNKLESPSPKYTLFRWNWPSGSGEEDFKNLSIYFRNFVIISPGKRAEPFIWTNLNPLHPRVNYPKFGWNWPSGFKEEDENVKSLTSTNFDQKSSLESSAQLS